MNWSINGKELHGALDPVEIVAALNLCAKEKTTDKNKYYLLSDNSDAPTISNVPPSIYKEETLKRYVPPTDTDIFHQFILDLQINLDIVQKIDASDVYRNGKYFQLNQCISNSRGLFLFVKHLSNINTIKLNPAIKIVLGYMVSKIPGGTVINDIVVQTDLLYLHDWHVWNYLDNILIDLSIFKYGNLISLDSDIQSWGKADDHVFIHPPPGKEYFGNAYNDMTTFEARIAEHF